MTTRASRDDRLPPRLFDVVAAGLPVGDLPPTIHLRHHLPTERTTIIHIGRTIPATDGAPNDGMFDQVCHRTARAWSVRASPTNAVMRVLVARPSDPVPRHERTVATGMLCAALEADGDARATPSLHLEGGLLVTLGPHVVAPPPVTGGVASMDILRPPPSRTERSARRHVVTHDDVTASLIRVGLGWDSRDRLPTPSARLVLAAMLSCLGGGRLRTSLAGTSWTNHCAPLWMHSCLMFALDIHDHKHADEALRRVLDEVDRRREVRPAEWRVARRRACRELLLRSRNSVETAASLAASWFAAGHDAADLIDLPRTIAAVPDDELSEAWCSLSEIRSVIVHPRAKEQADASSL